MLAFYHHIVLNVDNGHIHVIPVTYYSLIVMLIQIQIQIFYWFNAYRFLPLQLNT